MAKSPIGGISGRMSSDEKPSVLRRIQQTVNDLSLCDFYHTVELPDGSLTNAQWDLRGGVNQYLGDVDFSGKSVLEIGPASGFLSFHMEKNGAKVTCIEPPIETFWDLVPRADVDLSSRRIGLGHMFSEFAIPFGTFIPSTTLMWSSMRPALTTYRSNWENSIWGCLLPYCYIAVHQFE